MIETQVPGTAAVVVIGGGPAGMAAAAAATQHTDRVVLIDASPRLGGQYWRHGAKDEAPGSPAPRWHHGWSTFRSLHQQIQDAGTSGALTVFAETHVWALDTMVDGRLAVRIAPIPEAGPDPQRIDAVIAENVVLCPGAYDRQLPLPGWTLPGVMAAGGVQAYIKVQEQSPGRRVVLAGTGPFLLAAAVSVIQAGAEVAAICESSDLTGWVPRGVTAALVPSKGAEGAQYAALLARHRVPYLTRHAVTAIHGTDRVSAVEVTKVDRSGRPVPGSTRHLDEVDAVGLGWGFVPQAELLVQTGADTRLDVDGSLVGVVDAQQRSTVPGLFLAGEITGVTGAAGAVAEGTIAGRAAAGRTAARAGGGSLRRDLRPSLARGRHRTFARAMHRAHLVPEHWLDWSSPETVVCRCEEVTLGEIVTARDDLELDDARSLKGSTRAGMGFCQGRICGFAATCIAAAGAPAAHSACSSEPSPQRREAEARTVSRRPFALPLTLGALADDDSAGKGPTERDVVAEPLPRADERT
ncbi:MAG: FAD/NAD(P)-binding oxidoreductase [Pseudoxanthomonas suwonensis]|nr:MAG: FAD/NAD(P)-binding oxidoreductase [Pseudoxanthomonas suwonensis]